MTTVDSQTPKTPGEELNALFEHLVTVMETRLDFGMEDEKIVVERVMGVNRDRVAAACEQFQVLDFKDTTSLIDTTSDWAVELSDSENHVYPVRNLKERFEELLKEVSIQDITEALSGYYSRQLEHPNFEEHVRDLMSAAEKRLKDKDFDPSEGQEISLKLLKVMNQLKLPKHLRSEIRREDVNPFWNIRVLVGSAFASAVVECAKEHLQESELHELLSIDEIENIKTIDYRLMMSAGC